MEIWVNTITLKQNQIGSRIHKVLRIIYLLHYGTVQQNSSTVTTMQMISMKVTLMQMRMMQIALMQMVIMTK